MRAHTSKQDGVALILVVFAITIILGAIAFLACKVHAAKRFSDVAVLEAKLGEVCKGGIDIGVEQIWNQYIIGNGNTTGNMASYRVFLDDLVDNNEDLNGNGAQDGGESDADGNGTFDVGSPLTIISTSAAPRDLAGGGEIIELAIARTDDVTGTDLTITATGRVSGRTRTATQTVRVSGALFKGFEYGILANNINCILCHAEIFPLDLATNTDSSLYGTFDRVKVAALESLMVRSGTDAFGAHSRVAGTVYTRGSIYNQYGSEYSAASLASSTFRGKAFSDENGKVLQDSSGNMTDASFQNAGIEDGFLEQFANLYMNYPEEDEYMTDGDLPTSFPSPFPDENNDRFVNDDELAPFVASASGSISGGVVYGVPDGTTYAGDALPAASNAASAEIASTGVYEGNLILVGTEDDPIEIDQDIVIDGDLVIQGPVKGWGQLLVRGNAYVTGDVTYADAAGSFGEAEDGTSNGLALVAGGSILIGDYLTIWAKDDKGSSNIWYDEWIDMRAEHKSNYTSKGYEDVGYFDDGVVDEGWTQSDGEDNYSFTTSELMLFNTMEHQKAEADADYTPRYYRIRPTQPIYEYTGYGQDAMGYDEYGVEIISDLSGAAVHDLNPSSYWLTEDQLRQFWHNDEMTRPDTGRPFKFDGLLYTNNCIFCVTHSKQYHNSNTMGQMTIRGSVVAPDLGVFVPGANSATTRDALKLYYDRRVRDFFRVEDTTQVEFNRVVFRYG